MQPAVRSTIRKLYAYQAIKDFILLYPLYAILFALHGLSTFQISTLFIIWSVTDLLTNVPTGVLADKYSRKHLLALGMFITAAGFLSWWILPDYLGFAAGFILWGIGGALSSGTYEALVYDELVSAGIESQYVKINGRATSFALVANCLATALAGLAVLLGFGFVVAASIIASLLSAGFALSLPSAPRSEAVADTRYFSMLAAGISQSLRSRTLLALIALGAFLGTIYGTLEEYVPLFFHQAGFSLSVVPPLVAATVLVAALASFIAHRFEKLPTRYFMLLLVISGLFLMFSGIILGLGAIGLIVGYTFIIKLLATIFDGKVQHSIRSGLRATVTSVSFFVVEVMSVAVYLVYGILSRQGGNFAAFKYLGGFVAIVALCYLLLAPRLLAARSDIGSVRSST